MSIIQKAEKKILAAPQERIPLYANALNYSLYINADESLKCFSPRQIAVRWEISIRELLSMNICVMKNPGIPMVLNELGVAENLTSHQIERYFATKRYNEEFPGRKISTRTTGGSSIPRVFSYSEIYRLAIKEELIQNGSFEFPESLVSYIDDATLAADVEDRTHIRNLLKGSKYPDNS